MQIVEKWLNYTYDGSIIWIDSRLYDLVMSLWRSEGPIVLHRYSLMEIHSQSEVYERFYPSDLDNRWRFEVGTEKLQHIGTSFFVGFLVILLRLSVTWQNGKNTH